MMMRASQRVKLSACEIVSLMVAQTVRQRAFVTVKVMVTAEVMVGVIMMKAMMMIIQRVQH